jgi:hypoxanthine phosphoribosyltransferase
MLLDLAQQIRKDQYKPDIIVGVSRGGWPPARVMSDLLQNPNLANMKVEFYKDIGVRNKKPRITQPVTMEVVGKRVLVVDDVSDTGHSLRVVANHLRRKTVKELRVCTIYMKPQSVFRPDYYARTTRKWIIFPWERLEAVHLVSKRFRDERTRVSSTVRALKGSGMSARLVRQLLRIDAIDKKD